VKVREPRSRRGPDLRHGLSRTPEYRAWQLIRLRCTNPKHAAYPNYGGRGITMHEPWIEDPAAFVAHVGKRPSPAHEIDRIDNNRSYEPGNLRWATRKQQARNRRTNRLVTFRGETLTVAEWCERLSLPVTTISKRIKNGRSPEDALTTPVREKRSNGHPKMLSKEQAWELFLLGAEHGGDAGWSANPTAEQIEIRDQQRLVFEKRWSGIHRVAGEP
jgi:hypothetical protein